MKNRFLIIAMILSLLFICACLESINALVIKDSNCEVKFQFSRKIYRVDPQGICADLSLLIVHDIANNEIVWEINAPITTNIDTNNNALTIFDTNSVCYGKIPIGFWETTNRKELVTGRKYRVSASFRGGISTMEFIYR